MIAIFFKIIVMHLSPSIWLKVNIQNSPEYFTKSFQKQTMKKKLHLTLILQLKNLFKERNIPYPLIYNSYDLLLMLDKLHITNMYDLCLTTFDFTSLYTNISYHDTTRAIIMSCKLLNLPNFYRDYLLNLNKNETLLLLVIPPTSYQGVAMDSYHSRQIMGLVLSLLSKFSLFNNNNCSTK